MRQYDIVTGILLISSIIYFTLAAPILVQEKLQARVDVVNIPKDVIIVVEKRWGEELEKIGEPLLKMSESGKPEPNPASSTANPESSCWGDCLSSTIDTLKFMLSGDLPMHGPGAPMVSGYGLYGPYHELAGIPATKAPQPEKPWISPSADPNFDWHYWMNAEDPPPSSTQPRPPSPEMPPTIKEKGQASGHAPGPLTDKLHPYPESEMHSPSPGAGSPTGPPEREVVPRPPPSPDNETPLDDQSLSAGSQPPDLQAAIYAAKGKAKESRRISGTTRDVGNAAGNTTQRELQPAGRSLDRGE